MEKRYCLSQTDKKIAGVCGGLAEYFDVDPLLIRVAFLIFTFAGGSGILLYIVLALLAPKGPNAPRQNHFSNSQNSSNGTYGSSSNSNNRRPNQETDWGGSHYDKG